MFYYAIRHYGGGWADVADVLMRPLVCGILSVGAAWLIAKGMARADRPPAILLQLSKSASWRSLSTALLARLWMRPVWDDLWLRLGGCYRDGRLRPSPS